MICPQLNLLLIKLEDSHAKVRQGFRALPFKELSRIPPFLPRASSCSHTLEVVKKRSRRRRRREVFCRWGLLLLGNFRVHHGVCSSEQEVEVTGKVLFITDLQKMREPHIYVYILLVLSFLLQNSIRGENVASRSGTGSQNLCGKAKGLDDKDKAFTVKTG